MIQMQLECLQFYFILFGKVIIHVDMENNETFDGFFP